MSATTGKCDEKKKKIDCFSINKSSAAHLPELNIDNLKLFTFVHTKKIGTSVSYMSLKFIFSSNRPTGPIRS